MSQYKYVTTNGQPPYRIDEATFDHLTSGSNVAEPYEAQIFTDYNQTKYVWVEVYEIYEEGKTQEDYPDGNPYADSVWQLPTGYQWAHDCESVEKMERIDDVER